MSDCQFVCVCVYAIVCQYPLHYVPAHQKKTARIYGDYQWVSGNKTMMVVIAYATDTILRITKYYKISLSETKAKS